MLTDPGSGTLLESLKSSKETKSTSYALEKISEDLMAFDIFDTIIYIADLEGKEIIADFPSFKKGNLSFSQFVLDFDLITEALETRRKENSQETELCSTGEEYVSDMTDDNILESLSNMQLKDTKVPV